MFSAVILPFLYMFIGPIPLFHVSLSLHLRNLVKTLYTVLTLIFSFLISLNVSPLSWSNAKLQVCSLSWTSTFPQVATSKMQVMLVLALLGFFVPMGCTPILLIMFEVYKVNYILVTIATVTMTTLTCNHVGAKCTLFESAADL